MTKKRKIIYTLELVKDELRDAYYFNTKVKGREKISIIELTGLIEIYKHTFFKEAGVGSKIIKHGK